MKNYLFLFLAFILLLGSCFTLSFDSSGNTSWTALDRGKEKGTIRIMSVTAEKSSEWGSIQKEISALLPLLFLEESYLTVSENEKADYTAEVNVREREYYSGWKTKRSLSVELRLWTREGNDLQPISAGVALNNGNGSLASSQMLAAMLRKAVKSAIKGLPAKVPSFNVQTAPGSGL